MGPRATLVFEEKLFAKLPGNDQSLPKIICSNNGAIPDRTAFLLEKGDDPLNMLVKEAALLLDARTDLVCMPCNTAHSPRILARLMAIIPLPVIDMPAACVLKAEEGCAKKILVLGTRGAKVSGVFELRTKVPCVYPNESGQLTIDEAINVIKSGQDITDTMITKISEVLSLTDADTVILGCTELSMLSESLSTKKSIIDSLDVLAERCSQLCSTLYLKKEISK